MNKFAHPFSKFLTNPPDFSKRLSLKSGVFKDEIGDIML